MKVKLVWIEEEEERKVRKSEIREKMERVVVNGLRRKDVMEVELKIVEERKDNMDVEKIEELKKVDIEERKIKRRIGKNKIKIIDGVLEIEERWNLEEEKESEKGKRGDKKKSRVFLKFGVVIKYGNR